MYNQGVSAQGAKKGEMSLILPGVFLWVEAIIEKDSYSCLIWLLFPFSA